MHPKICRCCGGEILARAANPNLCVDCERLTEDDSPIRAAEVAEETSALAETAGDAGAPWESTARTW